MDDVDREGHETPDDEEEDVEEIEQEKTKYVHRRVYNLATLLPFVFFWEKTAAAEAKNKGSKICLPARIRRRMQSRYSPSKKVTIQKRKLHQ